MIVSKIDYKIYKHSEVLNYFEKLGLKVNENRKICDAFLKENPDFSSIRALPDIERTVEEGDYLTLFPHKNNCDGFFVAVFVRK